MKFQPCGLVQQNWQIFFWTELETNSQFFPKLAMTLQCHKMKLLAQFLAQPMYLLEKTFPSNLNFRPSGLLEPNSQIFSWAELETCSYFPPKFSMAFQCLNMKVVSQFWAQRMYFLEKIIPSNLKFRSCGSLERNWEIFFYAELQTCSHFPPKLSMAFECHNIKLVQQFLAQPMSLLEKNIP